MPGDWQFETQCIHGGYTPDAVTRSRQVPLYMTSSYTFADCDTAAAVFKLEQEGYIYTRVNNPTNATLEHRLALLEGMEDGLATATGLAATHLVLSALTQQGDDIVLSPKLYGAAYRQFAYHAPRMGIHPIWVDVDDPDGWEKALTPNTKFLYLETPGNPALNVIDIAQVSALAKAHGVPLVVDNTFATPYLQQPAKLGAEIVIHSTTKYLAGNSTVMGGMVLGSQALINRIRSEDYRNLGPTASPFNSWLLLLSMESLPLRMERHCQNAMHVARFLEDHPKVTRVLYPGLPSHPEHALALRQMRAFGGMIAFEMAGGFAAGKAVIDAMTLCSLVANVGDSRTLAIHPASTTHLPLSEAEQQAVGITPGLVRLSVGLEHINDILADLDQALEQVTG